MKVLIAYESVEVGLDALQLYQRVARRFAEDYRFHLSLWHFDALGVPSLGKKAAQEASAADLLIIATNREDRVRLSLRVWMEQWNQSKVGENSALVHLTKSTDGPPHRQTPLRAYLRDFASRGTLTLLSDSSGTMDGVRHAFSAPIEQRPIRTAAVPVRELRPVVAGAL